jgi:hypothetical protein
VEPQIAASRAEQRKYRYALSRGYKPPTRGRCEQDGLSAIFPYRIGADGTRYLCLVENVPRESFVEVLRGVARRCHARLIGWHG